MTTYDLIAKTTRIAKCWAVLALAVSINGCALPPPDQENSRAAPRFFVEGLDINAMNDEFVRGFGEIKDRAFEDPDLEHLFLAALGGLTTIDPDLQVTSVFGRRFVNYRGRPIKDLGNAPRHDIAAWSLETLKILVVARKASAPLRAADDEAIYKAIFTGALSALDPFSRYASRQDAVRNRLVRDGVIGLGVRLELSGDGATVKAIVRDGPAEIAGLDLDDVITHADGVSLKDRSLADVRHRLDGGLGTSVTLTFQRRGEPEPRTVTAALDLVVPDTVSSNFNDGVLVVRVLSFNQRTAAAVESAVTAAKREYGNALKGIVLDLRGNPGGLLDQAIDVADLFIESGTIATLHGRHPGANQYYAARRGDIAEGAPIVVLIDGKSASAAEIVAAALQDNKRAATVGSVSWGKGSVQTLRHLPNGGEIALTWARMVTPRGVELHGLGLLPDVCMSGTPPSVGEVVDFIYTDAQSGRKNHHDWQAAADDPLTHENLRTECPPEPLADRPADLEVALRIIRDPTLMALTTLDDAPQLAVKP